jgi:hypothetical protein
MSKSNGKPKPKPGLHALVGEHDERQAGQETKNTCQIIFLCIQDLPRCIDRQLMISVERRQIKVYLVAAGITLAASLGAHYCEPPIREPAFWLSIAVPQIIGYVLVRTALLAFDRAGRIDEEIFKRTNKRLKEETDKLRQDIAQLGAQIAGLSQRADHFNERTNALADIHGTAAEAIDARLKAMRDKRQFQAQLLSRLSAPRKPGNGDSKT